MTFGREGRDAHLFETEIEFEIVKPRDLRIDTLPRQFFGQVLIMAAQERGVGWIVKRHDDGLLLHADVPFQTLKETASKVGGVPLHEGLA